MAVPPYGRLVMPGVEITATAPSADLFDDLDEALCWANDTWWGLRASLFIAMSRRRQRRPSAGLRRVLINEAPSRRTDQQPYGGLRASGDTGEESAWSVREMLEERLIIPQTPSQ